MARSRETKIELTAYDDLFQTDESREEAKLSKIRDIPISEINEFPDHPFKVLMDEDMEQLVESIKRRQIAFRPAVEVSYLTEEQQYTLLEAMEYNDATPSLAQAIKMKKYNQDGKLNSEVIQSIMEEEKPNQKEKPAFRDERITKLIPKTVPRGQETDFVVKALEFYNRHLQRNKAHER